jgi:hypothetical protein
MPSIATLKLIGYGVGALAVIALLAMVNGWRVERNHLRDWQTTVVVAARDASGSPKLAAKDVPQQIKLLGQAVIDLKLRIVEQNAAVAALGAESEREKAAAEQAARSAEKRAQGAQATSARLTASSRAGGPPCEPSKALKGAWQ